MSKPNPLPPSGRADVNRHSEPSADPNVPVTWIPGENDPTPSQDFDLPSFPTALGTPTSSGLRFRVVRPHARGGLGDVFVAYDEELHREVALKEIQPRHAGDGESRSRFLLEAEVTGRLEHPGVVPVYGLGRHPDGRPFYAMRFIKGDTLKDAVDRFHRAEVRGRDPGERALALRELLARFVAVCNAVAYAHSRGVLHRDLKPANIMLGAYGETLVVDWGLAKVTGRREGEARGGEAALRPRAADGLSTVVGTVMGTPGYVSPEQAMGAVDAVGPASDIYSLGATLYHLLTGRPPVERKVVFEAKQGVPPALRAVCRKAMALKPEDRYGTALALAADVEHWLADEPVSAYREPWATRARRWIRRHKPAVAAAAAAALAVLLLGGAGAVWLERQRAERRVEQARQEERQRQEAGAALDKLPDLLRQWRWKEAETVLGEADRRLGEAGPADLRARAAQARVDLDLAVQLDTIRLRRATKIVQFDLSFDLSFGVRDIRRGPLTILEGQYEMEKMEQDYSAAFARVSVVAGQVDEEGAAARVRDSAIREQLVAALDDWAGVTRKPELGPWLLGIARRADPDDWRDRFRDPKVRSDRAALQSLANELLWDEARKLKAQSPQLLAALGTALLYGQGDAVPLLTEARERYPSDFWLHFELGNALTQAQKWGEAAGCYRAALAVQPEAVAVYNNLGGALLKGRLGGAIRVYQKALELDPKSAPTHNNLGLALAADGQMEKAIAAFEEAIKLDPDYAWAHYNLGIALKDKRPPEQLVPYFRKAAELDAKNAKAYSALGVALGAGGQLDEAIIAFEKAVKLDAKDAQTQGNFGMALLGRGRFAEAQAATQACLKLLPEGDPLRKLADQQLQQCERLLALDEKLRAILEGKDKPASDTERLDLAWLCLQSYRGYYATAARFYAESIDARPELVKDPRNGLRYDAARASALAAAGQGRDAGPLGEKERDRLRQQALDWLKADLAQWAKLAEGDAAAARADVRKYLQHWQKDPSLAGLRDEAALGNLPEAERAACQQLWAEVAELLKKRGG
jgi:Flp pilus assembly protein TadD